MCSSSKYSSSCLSKDCEFASLRLPLPLPLPLPKPRALPPPPRLFLPVQPLLLPLLGYSHPELLLRQSELSSSSRFRFQGFFSFHFPAFPDKRMVCRRRFWNGRSNLESYRPTSCGKVSISTSPWRHKAITMLSIMARFPFVPIAMISSLLLRWTRPTSSAERPKRLHSARIALSVRYVYKASALPPASTAVCNNQEQFSLKTEALSKPTTGIVPLQIRPNSIPSNSTCT
mmetsp:Transcript_85061/g.188907  ORF Transcript_85061/g.188907 Transcript_85061/m.188907 type:complete len:230 (-) Transcript_85061:666-1355(-)